MRARTSPRMFAAPGSPYANAEGEAFVPVAIIDGAKFGATLIEPEPAKAMD